MHLRKRNNKWQCLINHKGCRIAKTFIRKQDAQRWALKITTQLENNSFQDTLRVSGNPGKVLGIGSATFSRCAWHRRQYQDTLRAS